MPNIDPAAKAWQERRSAAFGHAVSNRRNALGLTASQLAERTKELGYPMTRSTVARIEGNHRAGKVDLAEVLALAAALDVAPVALLFPNLPDGEVERLPGDCGSAAAAVWWFTGEHDDPAEPAPGGLGRLLKLTRDRYKKFLQVERADFLLGEMLKRGDNIAEGLGLVDELITEIGDLERQIRRYPGRR